MVRVGIDEKVQAELLTGFPEGAKIVLLPSQPVGPIVVDMWVLPFFRKDAAQVFAHLREVKVVQSMMAGVEWILPWLPKDVTLCDGRGIHDISASEWVLGAILASLKRFPEYRDKQGRGEWRGASLEGSHSALYRVLGDDLAGKTVLIVGYGAIGGAIEARLKPFEVEILRIARTAKPGVEPVSALHALLPKADVVVLIVPMTQETKGLIGAEELALMKPGALLVNAARGAVVVTEALVGALGEGRIMAALDVTEPEPLPPGHPLWSSPNCLITPHIGGSTPQFIHRGMRLVKEQVQRMIEGRPLENVVQDDGY